MREVVVKPGKMTESEAKRSPVDTKKAINTAANNESAVAVRSMRSGDVIVTFATKAEENIRNKEWIEMIRHEP